MQVPGHSATPMPLHVTDAPGGLTPEQVLAQTPPHLLGGLPPHLSALSSSEFSVGHLSGFPPDESTATPATCIEPRRGSSPASPPHLHCPSASAGLTPQQVLAQTPRHLLGGLPPHLPELLPSDSSPSRSAVSELASDRSLLLSEQQPAQPGCSESDPDGKFFLPHLAGATPEQVLTKIPPHFLRGLPPHLSALLSGDVQPTPSEPQLVQPHLAMSETPKQTGVATQNVFFDSNSKALTQEIWQTVEDQKDKHQLKLHEQKLKASSPPPTNPDAMYPPTRDAPNMSSAPFDGLDGWKMIYGENCPVVVPAPLLPPLGPKFYYRVMEDSQPIYAEPVCESLKIGTHEKGEIVRIEDFRGGWAKVAAETEAQLEEKWEGWMLTEDGQSTLLEEISDPDEQERIYTRGLFRRVWRVHDHIAGRLRDRSERAVRYFCGGRVPPGKKDELPPEGTRALNAFWGLEARYVKLGPGEEYWPQGSMHLHPKEEGRAGHWRVFAARPFDKFELVEVCPLVDIDIQDTIHSMPLRYNIIEVPKEEASKGRRPGRALKVCIAMGYGMLYQQSICLEDASVNFEPISNWNCQMIPTGGHLYIYTTRRVLADEELVLRFERCFRTDQGETIDWAGFTPYWRRERHPETFSRALSVPHGPRKVRPVPGSVKFGKSKLHDRGIFTDANFKRGEIVEICPCLILDGPGARGASDLAFKLPAIDIDCGGRKLVKRSDLFVIPLGYGSMHNHLPRDNGENLQWFYDETTQCMVYIACPKEDASEIPRNTELCIDYGDAYWDDPMRRLTLDWKRKELVDVSTVQLPELSHSESARLRGNVTKGILAAQLERARA